MNMRTRASTYIEIVRQDIRPRKKPSLIKNGRKLVRLAVLILLMGAGLFVAAGIFFASNAVPVQNPFATLSKEERQSIYKDEKYAFLFNRTSMGQKYRDAGTSVEKNRVIESARSYLLTGIVTKLMPHWYGTPWGFNGMSETPGNGQIACGYFVTTVLRDVGFSLERIRLSQEPSETIISELVAEKYIKRYSNMDAGLFFTRMRQEGPGLYVVGLDKHIGFLLVEEEKMYFIHSSYIWGRGVVKEEAQSSSALVRSGYRVVGNLLGDPAVLKKWLQNEKMGS